jgi:molecular chaperone GrpE
MTEKKKHKHEEEVRETQAPVEEMPETTEQAADEFEALKRQLEEAQAQVSEFKESWMRTQAEFQNYRKRVESRNEEFKRDTKGDIIKRVLPALDDLERALQNRPADDAWASGIELIVRKLQTIIENEGVKRIEAKGEAFDPNFHEAISHEPADDVESGHVIEVVQNGYMLGERVIRPAMVRVAQ